MSFIKDFTDWLDTRDKVADERKNRKRQQDAADKKTARIDFLKERNRQLGINIPAWEAELAVISKWFIWSDKTKKHTGKSSGMINCEAALKAKIAGGKAEIALNTTELELIQKELNEPR